MPKIPDYKCEMLFQQTTGDLAPAAAGAMHHKAVASLSGAESHGAHLVTLERYSYEGSGVLCSNNSSIPPAPLFYSFKWQL